MKENQSKMSSTDPGNLEDLTRVKPGGADPGMWVMKVIDPIMDTGVGGL